ncbi:MULTISPECIES: TetR/AcrR family transcriptional regulator [unclassified Streptomyces]|uniref:TetR/AcrR family transcriptional regulator n=1 Tax=unclassified Streptomyces TaxID=2593676 RepID=UPI002E18DE12|nr:MULTISPECIES: TetR/AcrR family transcriptional regulator [unclassified Streptomyces]
MSAVQGTAKRVPNRWGEGQRLRQEILDAAGRLLVEKENPETISLRAIAREAGVTAPAIYKHFKDKNELMWALLDTVYATLAEKMRTAQHAAPADDSWAGLRAAIDTYCRLATEAPHRYDLLFRIGPGLPPPDHLPRHPMAQILDAWREAVTPYLATTGRDTGSADQIAKLLWSSLHGQLGLWRNVSQHTDDNTGLDELRDSLLSALFGRS